MAAAQSRVSDLHLVIVGEGPDRAAVEALARDVKVPIVFAGGVSDAHLPGFYQAADVVCSPALGDESFGLVLLEAMAAGRPIVASNIAGYAELLGPAGSARLADAGDVGSLTRELCAVLDDADLARALGERGAIAAQRYDWSAIATGLEAIYADALGSGTSGRNEYGSDGEKTSEASDKFERPFTR
jgi:phosphatidylinositol alpha-mannosyltransferase